MSSIVPDRLGKHKSRVNINHTVSKTFGSCKKATLEKIISLIQFMLLQKLDGYCDIRCIDVCEVRMKIEYKTCVISSIWMIAKQDVYKGRPKWQKNEKFTIK